MYKIVVTGNEYGLSTLTSSFVTENKSHALDKFNTQKYEHFMCCIYTLNTETNQIFLYRSYIND